MRKNSSRKGLMVAAFTTMFLVTILHSLYLPEATADTSIQTATVSITPESGHVGDLVRITGEISTPNGPYIIFFDQQEVKNGTAMDTAVNETFLVPASPMGNYTITLHDVSTKDNHTASQFFAIRTAYFIKATVPKPPEQLQEGESTKILVNVTGGVKNTSYSANITVTDPSDVVFYNDTLKLTNTTNTGYAEGRLAYPTEFGAGAHTNYTGTYNIAFNETMATASFTVGLTDRLEYVKRYLDEGVERKGEVSIRASGYHENETVTIRILYHENKTPPVEPVKAYSNIVKANAEGVVTDSLEIPENATLGIYTVALTNATPVAPKADIQNFTLIEIIGYCQAQNRYDPHPSPLPGVSVRVSDAEGHVGSGISNRTGWVDFLLDRGEYTFRAIWKGASVGSLNGSTTGLTARFLLKIEFYIKCELAHIRMLVGDESVPPRGLPFVNVTLMSNTTADSFETNYEGAVSTNVFTAVKYRIEARRFGHVFFNQSIGDLTITPPQIDITCPTHILFVSALDSNERPIHGATVEAIEWSSGRIAAEGQTDQWGSVRLNCTFGRYKVKVSDYSDVLGQTAVLSETVVDVIRNRFYLVLHCRTVNLDLLVKVIDYRGHPIPNAMVLIEREGMRILNLTTGPDGITSEDDILGGDYRISLYVTGKLWGVKSLYLDESREVIFQLANYVMVGGYLLEFNQLITVISLTIAVVLCAFTLSYIRYTKKS